jgi:hypothetical protein
MAFRACPIEQSDERIIANTLLMDASFACSEAKEKR